MQKLGKRVLTVDLDPQASLTFYFGQNSQKLEAEGKSLYFSLLEDKPLSSLIIHTNDQTPDLIANGNKLQKSDRLLVTKMRYSQVLLRDRLQEVKDQYDFVILDCPPYLNILTSNGLVASDVVIIPTRLDFLSLAGIPQLLEEIEEVRALENPRLTVLGVLPVAFSGRQIQHKDGLTALRAIVEPRGIPIFDPVPERAHFSRATGEGLPSVVLSPSADGVENYYQLARELITRYQPELIHHE